MHIETKKKKRIKRPDKTVQRDHSKGNFVELNQKEKKNNKNEELKWYCTKILNWLTISLSF